MVEIVAYRPAPAVFVARAWGFARDGLR